MTTKRNLRPKSPRLGDGVSLEPPTGPAGLWMVSLNGVPRARLANAVAQAAHRFDGLHSVTEIATALGGQWTVQDVEQVVERFSAAGLLDRGDRRRRSSPVHFKPPLTFQFSFGNPSRLLRRIRPVTKVFTSIPGLALATTAIIIGVLCAILNTRLILNAVSTPVDIAVAVPLVLAIVLTTVVHEFGHGIALSNFGGSPRRIGAMLFYLSPAFFCDVTDGWRLTRRTQRVFVALAGPLVHAVLASLSMIAVGFFPASPLRDGLVLYSIACGVIASLNLLPFVQLDGYLALMSALDRPHLRRTAMAAAFEWVVSIAFGVDRDTRAVPRQRWLVAFGLSCAAFPVVLVTLALARYAGSIAGAGKFSAAIYLVLLTYVLIMVYRSIHKAARQVLSAHPRLLPSIATGITVSLLVAFAAIATPIHQDRVGGFIAADGKVWLVFTRGEDAASALPGTAVDLQTGGLLVKAPLGHVTVSSAAVTVANVDLDAFLPLTGSALTLPATIVPAEDARGLDDAAVTAAEFPSHGQSVIRSRAAMTALSWLMQTYLGGPLRTLFGESLH